MTERGQSAHRAVLIGVLFIGAVVHTSLAAPSRPHILVIMADDLGWNDIGARDPEMHTPNIDQLASQGVNLSNSYMQQVCTPSRAAFLSGYYPFRMGLQHSVLTALSNRSMPLGYRVLSEHLKDLGYDTHMVGKWHLGFCNFNMTPNYRGFDTFYGMYTGKSRYFSHISKWNGYDMQDNIGKDPDNFRVAWEANGTYSTHLFTNRTVEILENHDQSKPLFIFLSYQAVHGPLEVPSYYVDKYCSNVTTGINRTLHCAMTAAMDEGIGNITAAAERLGFSDNLITLFLSDNGGPVKLGSSNWPLRGAKITLWEGGTKAVTILHSKKHLSDAPYEWDGLMHAVDWYPTLVRAAGDKMKITDIDGKDNWNKIRKGQPSKRKEFVYNIDDVKDTSALRWRQYKLINNSPGKPDGWYNPPAGVTCNRTVPKKYPEFMLFDISKDPSEETDISVNNEKLLKKMKKKLAAYQAQATVLTTEPEKPEVGKPRYNGKAWVSGWC